MSKQEIIQFNEKKIFSKDDYIFDETNKSAFEIINSFPNWQNNLVNLVGPKKSGKSLLLKILEITHSFLYISEKSFQKDNLDTIFKSERLILDIDVLLEDKVFSIVNDFYTNKKYLVISSNKPLTNIQFKLKDLSSRFKLFNIIEILNPSDHLIYSLIIKFFSDNQIVIKKELVNFIVKKIDRSYLRVNNFLEKLNNQSIVEKRKIDFKMINKVIDTMV